MDYTTSDIMSASGTISNYADKRVRAERLAALYDQFDEKKAGRVRNCGTSLLFARIGERRHLLGANFCKVRLCPMCQWRRAIKLYNELRGKVEFLGSDYRYVFLTLTVRNCGFSRLEGALDGLSEGWRRFSNLAKFKRNFAGYVRTIEITHNKEKDTLHPHIHVLLAVLPDYFSKANGDYWTHDEILRTWRMSMRLCYDPVCDIRAVTDREGMFSEICKYIAKEDVYLYSGAPIVNAMVLKELDRILEKRRFVSFGGIFQPAKWDEDDIDSDMELNEKDMQRIPLEAYAWASGYKSIELTDVDYHAFERMPWLQEKLKALQAGGKQLRFKG